MASPEILTTPKTMTIKGPLSPIEAQDVMFGQAERGRVITCLTFDTNGNPTVKTINPRELIETDDIGKFGDFHSALQAAIKIIIYP